MTFSLVLCNYNDQEYLSGALQAFEGLRQKPEEFILIDDGSTDNSLELMETFADRMDNEPTRVKILPQPVNRGVVEIMNIGLRAANEDYVAYCAADDRVCPGFVEAAAKVVTAHPGVGIVAGETALKKNGMEQLYRFPVDRNEVWQNETEFVTELKSHYVWLASSSAFIRRAALIEHGGFRPELEWLSDWFAVYSVAISHGVGYVHEVNSQVLVRDGSYGDISRINKRGRHAVYRRFLALVQLPEHRRFKKALLKAPLTALTPLGLSIVWCAIRSPRNWRLGLTIFLTKVRTSLNARRTPSAS